MILGSEAPLRSGAGEIEIFALYMSGGQADLIRRISRVLIEEIDRLLSCVLYDGVVHEQQSAFDNSRWHLLHLGDLFLSDVLWA
jgi:hypothetical protein